MAGSGGLAPADGYMQFAIILGVTPSQRSRLPQDGLLARRVELFSMSPIENQVLSSIHDIWMHINVADLSVSAIVLTMPRIQNDMHWLRRRSKLCSSATEYF